MITHFILVIVTALTISSCGGAPELLTPVSNGSTKLTCSTATAIESCWNQIQTATQSCFFYVPAYTSGAYGAFNMAKSTCTLGSKVVTFTPPYSNSGIFASTSMDSSLTFRNSGTLCAIFVSKVNDTGFSLADSNGNKFEITYTATGMDLACGGVTYTATNAELNQFTTDCPTAYDINFYGNSQSGSTGNYSNPSFRVGSRALMSEQSIECH